MKQGIREAGGTPMEFNTVTISDGITMGTEGMKASLISREVIADSIELVARGNSFDGIVCIAGCDKNMPGSHHGAGASRYPGHDALRRHRIAPGQLAQAGRHAQGHHHPATSLRRSARTLRARSTTTQLEAVEAAACPGPGACGGQFTANTMAMAGEFLGISPMQHHGRARDVAAEGMQPAARRVAW